jgi:hypothetical protein
MEAGARAGKLTLGLLLCAVVGIFTASSASAAYEQVGCFAGSFPGLSASCKPIKEGEKFGEEVQLGNVAGMAVNYTGAGGVPKGTVYAAVRTDFFPLAIAMYVPAADGGLEFRQRWVVKAGEGAYERCGPALGSNCKPLPGSANIPPQDVGVDQTTGNVYAMLSANDSPSGARLVVEFKPDGSAVLARFGSRADNGKTVAETPESIHDNRFGGLAVEATGKVYVSDLSGNYVRLMVFEPQSPGDYEHYVYAGEILGANKGILTQPVTDAAGNIYTTDNEETIEEWAPETPVAYPQASRAAPLCTYTFKKHGIAAITVEPTSGEVFFSDIKPPKLIRRLGPCNPATHEFSEAGPEPEAFALGPERDDPWALAFDPTRQIDPERAPGTLYAGAPSAEPVLGPGEPGQSALGYVFAHAKELPPEVQAESFTHVTSTGALLHAQVKTNSFQTHYAFEYETAAEYEANPPGERFAGAAEAPPGGADLPGAQGAQSAAAAIGGLEADTAYRFRAIVSSECEGSTKPRCEEAGEAKAFRTFPTEAPGLPDHRAYELVSPAQKNGGQVFSLTPRQSSCFEICKPGSGLQVSFPKQSAPGGDAVAYQGTPFSTTEGPPQTDEYVARRDPKTGWHSIGLAPAALEVLQYGEYLALDTELNHGLIAQPTFALSPEAPAGYFNLYSQASEDPSALTPLLSQARFAELPPQRSAKEFTLQYVGASADLSRVFFEANDALTAEVPGIAPAALDPGKEGRNLYEYSAGGLALVNVMPGNATTVPCPQGCGKAVSADGRRVFFSDATGQVYLREDGETTREIKTEGVPDPGKFLAAATDGSAVLLQNGHLHYLGNEEPTVDLTQEKGGFLGLVGQSEDLSHVYFVDTAALAAGAEAGTCQFSSEPTSPRGKEEEEGKVPPGFGCNLYDWHEGTTRLLATLPAKDNNNVGADWSPSPKIRTAEASPGGRYLAFLSKASLTGYENVGPRCEHNVKFNTTTACREVFLYDSASGTLRCPSCAFSGQSPLYYPPNLPTANHRYLTDEGRLYFDSGESLLPADTNEGVEDVYQWEPPAGPEEPEGDSCQREAGCLALISAGTGTVDSNFFAADQTGANVFLTSRDQLTLKDKDELFDLYDAREFGGIPAETETGEPECQGEGCLPQVAAPNDPTPGSSSFEGAGNVPGETPSKCRKPKVRRHGRCVARKHHKQAGRHHRRANRNRGGAK